MSGLNIGPTLASFGVSKEESKEGVQAFLVSGGGNVENKGEDSGQSQDSFTSKIRAW